MTENSQYYVYILTNKSGTLYVGMTNGIKERVNQHKNKLVDGFTKKYNINRLRIMKHLPMCIQQLQVKR
jgi:predicted GIY-YIG superfamily endonuclease